MSKIVLWSRYSLENYTYQLRARDARDVVYTHRDLLLFDRRDKQWFINDFLESHLVQDYRETEEEIVKSMKNVIGMVEPLNERRFATFCLHIGFDKVTKFLTNELDFFAEDLIECINDYELKSGAWVKVSEWVNPRKL